MNAREMEDNLIVALEDAGDTIDAEIRSVRTFEDVGMMTRNRGIVVTLMDGSEFQMSIVQSKYPHEDEEEEVVTAGGEGTPMQISKETMESLTCSQRKMINERFRPGASILSKPAKTSIEKGLKAMGMTQEKIAQKVGVASSTLSRYKLRKGDGKRRPSFKSLSRLAKATGRSPEQLFPELA